MAKKLTEAQIRAIKMGHDAGLSERDIAKTAYCSRSAVWYQLQKIKKNKKK
jgi:biotin operon repressor